jgi:uncharacterized protein (DUF362 family)
MNRRDFLRVSAAATAAAGALFKPERASGQEARVDLAVVQNGTPAEMTRRAVDAIGGMSSVVRRGDVVVVKPNMSWDRVPEQGATTNPDVMAEVVTLCLDAGAKTVKVFDFTLNEPARCYKRSGIQAAAKKAGADVFFVYDPRFKTVRFPDGEIVKSWSVYQDVLEADRIINVPCAKHHNVSGASLGMKNLMGWIGGNRGQFHRQFEVKIVDLSTRIRPHLIILDAYRQLLRNGPSGGNLADVVMKKTIVAGTDPVAVDSYGATLFNLNPKQVPFLVGAADRKLGRLDLERLNILKIDMTV